MILVKPNYDVTENMLLIGFLVDNNYVQDKISRDPKTGTTGIPNLVYDQYKNNVNNNCIDRAWLNVDGSYSVFINIPIIYIMHDILRYAREHGQEGSLNIMDVFRKALDSYNFYLSYQSNDEINKLKYFDFFVKKDKNITHYSFCPFSYDIIDNIYISSALRELNDIVFIEEIGEVKDLDSLLHVIKSLKSYHDDRVNKLVGLLHLVYNNKLMQDKQVAK